MRKLFSIGASSIVRRKENELEQACFISAAALPHTSERTTQQPTSKQDVLRACLPVRGKALFQKCARSARFAIARSIQPIYPSIAQPSISIMIPSEIKTEILARLRRAESEHDVKVLLAVESGSRAWGFASPNSDYDARFIYVHRPDWYLSVDLEEKRDVIEYPIVDDLDVNGWDLRKALRLFWKSNPGFVEWIQSPIVYETYGSFHTDALALLPHVYSTESGIHHYRSMAKTNYRGYLLEERVPIKKYFYVLRPLLSVRWLERFGKPAPIEFDRLLSVIQEEHQLLEAIYRLLEVKKSSPELGLSPPIPKIQSFIETELSRLELSPPIRMQRTECVSALSDVFRDVLQKAWAPIIS